MEHENNNNNNTEQHEAKRSPVRASATTTDGTFVGDFVAWEFGGGTDEFKAPRNAVADVFYRHGFKHALPAGDCDIASALLKAPRFGGIRKGRGVHVEAMERPNKDTPAALGIYLKHTNSGEGGDDFVGGARVRVDPTTNRAVALPLEGQTTPEPRCFALAEQIADRANELVSYVTNKELSEALTAAGRSLLWAPFRRKCGGAYFIHDKNAAAFRALVDELEKFDGFWPTIQPLFLDGDGRTLKNATQASEAALEKDVKDLEAQLDKLTNEGMRADTVDRRIAECTEVLVRAELYRSILREKVDVFTAKIAKLSEAFKGAKPEEAKKEAGVFGEIDQLLSDVDSPAKKAARTRKANKEAAAAIAAVVPDDIDDEDLFAV